MTSSIFHLSSDRGPISKREERGPFFYISLRRKKKESVKKCLKSK